MISLPVAVAAVVMRAVSRSGAAAGVIVASALLAGGGWPAWVQLGVALIFAAGATRAGRTRNIAGGRLDDRDGRGWRSVAANTGLAACAALYARDPGLRDLAGLVMAAALTAGAGDTVASEIGKAFGARTTVSLMPIRRVPPGTPGAVSVAGTLAGAASVAVMARCAGATGLIGSTDVVRVTVAAGSAILFDSVASRMLESRGWVDSDGINFLATCAAALVAVSLPPLPP